METTSKVLDKPAAGNGSTGRLLRCVFCDARMSLEDVKSRDPPGLCDAAQDGCGKTTGFAKHLFWDRALESEPLKGQISAPSGLVLKLDPSIVARLSKDLRANLAAAPEETLAALQQVLDAHGVPLAAPGVEALHGASDEASFVLTDDMMLLQRADAYYIRRETRDGGQKEWPVLARPLRIVKWLTVEGEPRVVMEDQAGNFAGTFGDAWRRLRENGQVLDPKTGERALARLKTDAPFAGDAPATFGLAERGGRLEVPSEFYPRPGHQTDAVRDVTPYLGEDPEPKDWEAWRSFFGHYHPREWMPLAGLAGIAPAALLLRDARVVVPAAYAYSRAGATGKTTLSDALSSKLYGLEALSGEAVNSDFRFLGMLNAAGLPRLVDEAERLEWNRYGAVLKAAMGARHAGDRGNKDRTVEAYLSRAVPFFTSNARPPLSRPVLARFLMLAFDEDRGTKSTPGAAQAVAHAVERLFPAGPAIAAALARGCETRDGLLAKHAEVAERLQGAREWEDTRRPGAWAAVYLGLGAWEEASAGVVAVPSVEGFLQDVVAPVEQATFEEPTNALEILRGWLDMWAQRNLGPDRSAAVTGFARVEVRDGLRVTGSRTVDASLVTTALLSTYNRDMEQQREVQFTGLKDLAREVTRQYGVHLEDLVDASGNCRVHTMSDGVTRQRAVPLPTEAPGIHAPRAGDA